MKKIDLLYIAYIDLEEAPRSGSSVRPIMMLKAFEKLDLKIKVLDGWNNELRKRRSNVKEVISWLKDNTPRFCYIEPPSGPIFNYIDLRLIKLLHKKNIPTGIFYRDAYHLFSEMYLDDNKVMSIKDKVKLIFINKIAKRDLKIFKRNIDHFFYPSISFGEMLKIDVSWLELPPGTTVKLNDKTNDILYNRIIENKALTCMYVGGLSKAYGTRIMLDSFKKINQENNILNLILVCRKPEWLYYEEQYQNESWLQVHHVNSETGLDSLYDEADFCLLPFEKNTYMDFAMPTKLMEYVSHCKPVLSTNCNEVERFILDRDIGWITNDNVDSFSNMLLTVVMNRHDIVAKKKNTIQAVQKNLWEKRANKVMHTLLNNKK